MLEGIIRWWVIREVKQECKGDFAALVFAFLTGKLDVPYDEALANLKASYVARGLTEEEVEELCRVTKGFDG